MTSTQAFYALALLLFTTFSSSCSSTSDQKSMDLDDVERILIDASSVEKEVDISDLIEEIRVFPLEEVEGSMLGDVEKVLLTDKHLIVFDRMETKKIVVFGREGRFVKSLEIVGDGPDKLAQINDVWLNNKGKLEVYDFSLTKKLTFNDQFEVEKAIRAKDRILFHYMLNMPGSDGYVAFAGGYSGQQGDPSKLAFLDNELAVQHTALPFDSLLMGASISTPISPMFRIGDALRFYQNFDPFIYTVNPAGNLDVQYYLDYVHRPLPKDFEQTLILENLQLFLDPESPYEDRKAIFEGYTGFRGQWMESEDYAVFSSFDTGHNGFNSIYHKGKKQIVAQGIDLREDQRYHMVLPTHFQAAEAQGNRFVVVMPGFWLSTYLPSKSPFYEQVEQNPETLFAMEVVLR